MKDGRCASRLLGLLAVAALGAMAFAASAQAGFLINKKSVGALLAIAEGKLEGVETMKVAGLNFELNCTTMVADEGHISSGTDAKVILLYTGCSALVLNKLPAIEELDCHVTEPIRSEALVLTTVTSKGEPALLVEGTKSLIVFHLKGTPQLKEKPCVLPLNNVVSGTSCLAITAGNDTVAPLVTHVQACSGDEIKYGAQKATLEAAAELFLVGTHTGMTLGVS
jgi:hypothetical protein